MELPSAFDIASAALGGVGVFLLGMRLMSDGLQALAGQRLQRLVSTVTDNRLLAVLVGVGVTCVIQSSTATTVMVVGFVNSGLMTLSQAIGVVFGANVGTTLTLWLLTLDISRWGAFVVGIAVFFYLFSRRERVRSVSMAVLGLGMLFFGLRLLTDGLAPLREMGGLQRALAFFRADSTAGFFGAAAVGAVVTFLLHSSAAFVAVVMGLAGAGLIDFRTAVAVVLGSNVGTTGTALIACSGASRNALRAALAHSLFNVAGLLLVSVFWRSFSDGCRAFADWARGAPADSSDPKALAGWYTFAIACVHSFFNVGTTLVLMPFMGLFARAVVKLVPVRESEKETEDWKPLYLDDRVVGQPAIALAGAQKEILRMGETCQSMLAALRRCIESDGADAESERSVFVGESRMDLAQKEISEYVGRAMRGAPLTGFFADLARREIRQADEFESVSDYIRNALKSFKKIRDAGERLSPEALEETLDLCGRVDAFMRETLDIVTVGDRFNVPAAEVRSREIDEVAKRYRKAHLARIGSRCSAPVKSLVYSDLLVAFRRQNDHLLNIAQTLEP